MKSKPVKRPQEKLESIPVLKKENVKLKKEISRLKKEKAKAERKIHSQETTILTINNQKVKAVKRFFILQVKYNKLKRVNKTRERSFSDCEFKDFPDETT